MPRRGGRPKMVVPLRDPNLHLANEEAAEEGHAQVATVEALRDRPVDPDRTLVPEVGLVKWQIEARC